MKDHMDAKFPNMKMPDMTSFKMLVKLFGMGMQDAEKKITLIKITCCHGSLEDHGQLPASYLKSTQKFFDELQATSHKRQASSNCHNWKV